jgi:hypothetical protein
MLLPLLHACYTRTTCSALLPCTDCTLAPGSSNGLLAHVSNTLQYYSLYDCGSLKVNMDTPARAHAPGLTPRLPNEAGLRD